MKILIVGAGETGYFIAKEFSEENVEVVLVDEKPKHLEHLQRTLNVAGVVGNGTSLKTLEQAGVDSCDFLIACTDHDESNLICCLIANQFKVPVKIAVTRTDSFLKRKIIQRYLSSGVSQIINSSVVTAQEVIATATYSSASAVSVFGDRKVLLVGCKIKAASSWKGKKLFDIRSDIENQDFLIASIVRGGDSFIPTGMDEVLEGDYIYVLAPKTSVPLLDEILQTKVLHNRRAVVVGSGFISQRVVLGLLHSHYQVTVICSDQLEFHNFKDKFSHHKDCNVVFGDPSNVKFQLRHEVATSALFIAVTKDDMANITSALIAKYLGAAKTIAIVNREELTEPAQLMEIDVVLSPRLSTARTVKKSTQGGLSDKLNFTTISETNMEVREMVVGPGCSIAGKALKDVALPKGCLIGAIVHTSEEVEMAKGSTVIEVNDQVIAVTTPESSLKLKELFNAQ
ncbi:MAG: Trk system potassium transporter TrkA [SAR324 cluster bacterium]|nr:Trk system potassium transporter TrkA [SAR324 cluster bacterium]